MSATDTSFLLTLDEPEEDLDRCSHGCVCTPAERYEAMQPGAYVLDAAGRALECFDDAGEAGAFLAARWAQGVATERVVVID